MPSARSILAAARTLALDVETLALPQACLGCERPLSPREEADACCALCRHRMRRIAPPVCARCGQPLDRWNPGCGFCASWPPELAWAASAVWLDDGPARNLVHALKYGGWRIAAGPMAATVVETLSRRLAGLDALVPVPLAPARLRERGANQAASLACAIGAASGVRLLDGALRRTRETRTQTRLPPAARWRNVSGAFAAAGERLHGMHVALVDDVVTTGATLGAAAQALAQSRPASIGAVTFARALVPA
jgi:ComF family protein